MPEAINTEYWQLPELTSINRLPMSSCLIPHPSEKDALTCDRHASPWFAALNGTWDFRLFPRPQAVPGSAVGTGRLQGFRPIEVPGNWTLQDVGDAPIYTNVQMPFENNPPVVPADNPTGVYRTAVSIPPAWRGRRVVIHVGGAESYYELYVNGAFAGMAKDSRLPSEFDITGFLRARANTIAIKVVRWSDSSYVEDQDHWWMAGIYRDVYLYTTAEAAVDDLFARCDYDVERRSGTLSLSALFSYRPLPSRDAAGGAAAGPPGPCLMAASLFDRDDRRLWAGSTVVDPSFRVNEYRHEFHADLPGVTPWSSERPELYRLAVTLTSAAGQVVESRCVRVGFRRVEVADRQLLINGRPVLIRGVNRHEHDERRGKVMTRELMERDLMLLKSFNFNAVRTSHYPNTIEWYDLCDEYGIYLVDEANIEAHANYTTICRDPRWSRAFEERIIRMAQRDKNHPSVIAWSAGNESGHGENHVRALELLRAYDPSRLIHHEGELKRLWLQGGVAPANAYTGGCNRSNDLVNPMYPPIEEIVAHALAAEDPRPVILCEYSHAMGNSNGSLAEYWDAFERYHGLQGGFIWEWVDHGLLRTDAKGRSYWAYGGDFGEKVHDANFVADGLVWPDRTPHPAMYEFKKLAQPVGVRAVCGREGRFLVRNRQDFVSLDWLVGSWTLEVEGIAVDSGTLPLLEVPPGGELEVRLGFARGASLDDREAWVRFDFRAREATRWCDAGHQVGWEQFMVNPEADGARPHNDAGVPPHAGDSAHGTRRRGAASPPSSAAVDTRGAVLTSGTLAVVVPLEDPKPPAPVDASFGSRVEVDSALLVEGPRLNLFRAPTDNDGIRLMDGQESKPLGQWLAAGLDALSLVSRRVEVDESIPALLEECEYAGSDPGALIRYSLRTRAGGAGIVRYDVSFDIPDSLPSLPRVGVILRTAAGFESLRWYGRGPHENHQDRKAGAPVGLYAGTVSEQYVRYILPQENGSKCDVRWFELSNGRFRLRFSADPLFEFSAHHFTPEDLYSCRHTNEVEDLLRKETIVSIDVKQRGVGTGSCGPQTRDPYRVDPGRYEFGFELEVRPAGPASE